MIEMSWNITPNSDDLFCSSLVRKKL